MEYLFWGYNTWATSVKICTNLKNFVQLFDFLYATYVTDNFTDFQKKSSVFINVLLFLANHWNKTKKHNHIQNILKSN